jgi:chitin disaccharide deacetylase
LALQNEFVFRAFISTRFSTELLKTFTKILYFLCGLAMECFQKCAAAFPAVFFRRDREFSCPKRSLPARRARAGRLRRFVRLLSSLLGCKISQSRMKSLILNADDLGMTRGVNEGIIRAHREGILTSTTLMANGPSFDDAVERIAANPQLGVGCHLVLVGGKCIARRETVGSLADADGNLPESLPRFVARLSSGMIPASEIERELRAQIEKIRAAGITPTHLDTHKHTHAHPRVMEALARVAKEFGIKRVRKPVENLHDSWQTMQADEKGITMQIVAAGAVRAVAPRFLAIARKYGLLFPDHFLGLAVTGQVSAAALRRMVDTLDDGSTEIMLHPGICDADLVQSGTRLREQRETELAALLDPNVRIALNERGVRLISYRELN